MYFPLEDELRLEDRIGLDWIELDWRVGRLDWIGLEDWKIGRLEDRKICGLMRLRSQLCELIWSAGDWMWILNSNRLGEPGRLGKSERFVKPG